MKYGVHAASRCALPFNSVEHVCHVVCLLLPLAPLAAFAVRAVSKGHYLRLGQGQMRIEAGWVATYRIAPLWDLSQVQPSVSCRRFSEVIGIGAAPGGFSAFFAGSGDVMGTGILKCLFSA